MWRQLTLDQKIATTADPWYGATSADHGTGLVSADSEAVVGQAELLTWAGTVLDYLWTLTSECMCHPVPGAGIQMASGTTNIFSGNDLGGLGTGGLQLGTAASHLSSQCCLFLVAWFSGTGVSHESLWCSIDRRLLLWLFSWAQILLSLGLMVAGGVGLVVTGRLLRWLASSRTVLLLSVLAQSHWSRAWTDDGRSRLTGGWQWSRDKINTR